ncbi:hypothetical protein N0V85_009100, partial [Neurospora sp. IMI 360204]
MPGSYIESDAPDAPSRNLAATPTIETSPVRPLPGNDNIDETSHFDIANPSHAIRYPSMSANQHLLNKNAPPAQRTYPPTRAIPDTRYDCESRTMSAGPDPDAPLPCRPAKFGANRESVDYLEDKINRNNDVMTYRFDRQEKILETNMSSTQSLLDSFRKDLDEQRARQNEDQGKLLTLFESHKKEIAEILGEAWEKEKDGLMDDIKDQAEQSLKEQGELLDQHVVEQRELLNQHAKDHKTLLETSLASQKASFDQALEDQNANIQAQSVELKNTIKAFQKVQETASANLTKQINGIRRTVEKEVMEVVTKNLSGTPYTPPNPLFDEISGEPAAPYKPQSERPILPAKPPRGKFHTTLEDVPESPGSVHSRASARSRLPVLQVSGGPPRAASLPVQDARLSITTPIPGSKFMSTSVPITAGPGADINPPNRAKWGNHGPFDLPPSVPPHLRTTSLPHLRNADQPTQFHSTDRQPPRQFAMENGVLYPGQTTHVFNNLELDPRNQRSFPKANGTEHEPIDVDAWAGKQRVQYNVRAARTALRYDDEEDKPERVPKTEKAASHRSKEDKAPYRPGAPDGGGGGGGSSNRGRGGGRPRSDKSKSKKGRSRKAESGDEFELTEDEESDEEDYRKVKREEIGIFNPTAYDPDDVGIITDPKGDTYTDVYAFREQVLSFVEGGTDSKMGRQMSKLFQTLLGGPAKVWWSTEVDAASKRSWRADGIFVLLNKLVNRFKPNPAIATSKFNKGYFTLSKISENEGALTIYVQRQLRYARAMGTMGKDSTDNWYGVMMQIWSSLDLRVKQYLRAPLDKEELSDYMTEISTANAVLIAAAARSDSSSRRNDRSDNRNRSDRDRNRDRSRDDRNRDRSRDNRDRNRDSERNRDRSRDNRDRSRDGDRNRDHNRDRNRDKDLDHERKAYQANYVADTGNETQADTSDESDIEHVNLVLESKKRCRKCHKSIRTSAKKKQHKKTCKTPPSVKAEKIRTPSPLAPEQRTCGYCRKMLLSRNILFKHLKTCKLAQEGRLAGDEPRPIPRITPAPISRSSAPPRVKEAPRMALAEIDNSPISSFTHMRVNARPSLEGKTTEVCMDPGTGRTLIGRSFLNTLVHTTETRHAKVKGVGGRPVKINEWATFEVYLEGFDKQGQPTLMKFKKGGWVVDELEPNVLFGNDFLHSYAANTDYKTGTITFRDLDDFCVDFVAQENAKPCVRKVTTTSKTTLLSGQSGYIPVSYKELPKDRSFMMNSKHALAANA